MTSLVSGWARLSRPVQYSICGMGAPLVAAILYLIVTGTPRAVAPSNELFAQITIGDALAASQARQLNPAFAMRPLFTPSRRPATLPEQAADQDIQISAGPDEPADTFPEGDVLGIFGSGDVKGAIIRLKNGGSRRLTVGESLQGWTLESVADRIVRLVSTNGDAGELSMVRANNQTPITGWETNATGGGEELAAEPGAQDPLAEDATDEQVVAKPSRVTFESIYRDRYQTLNREPSGPEGEPN